MLNVKDVCLTDEELQRCIEFSKISAGTQQAFEFGQHNTKPRPVSEISRDTLIGKIAEVAFSKMMKENYGIDVPLDFNYYPRGQWDDQDAVINGWRIDVKGTRKGGQWMLIEWNKLDFRQRDNNLSHVYVMFTVDWDRKSDQPTGRVSYQGAASLNKLKKSCPTTATLRKGTKIPGTDMYLQADNYGIQFKDLYKHLNHLVEHLMAGGPPQSLIDSFQNPYTDETTIQILAKNNITASKPLMKQEKQKGLFERLSFWANKIFCRAK